MNAHEVFEITFKSGKSIRVEGDLKSFLDPLQRGMQNAPANVPSWYWLDKMAFQVSEIVAIVPASALRGAGEQ